jgi:hypothetical protein
MPRPDVAEAYGQPAFEATGFRALIPAEALPPGRHQLSLKVLTPDRSAYTVSPQIVELIVEAGSPVDPGRLTRLEQTTWGVVDTVNGAYQPSPHKHPLPITTDQPLEVKGWAVDALTGRPARGGFLAVDDKWYFPVRFGVLRPELPVGLENVHFASSGYEAIIPAGALPPGRHVLTLRVVTQDGRSYYSPLPEQTIEIEIQRGP